jgi:hypothetical protein
VSRALALWACSTAVACAGEPAATVTEALIAARDGTPALARAVAPDYRDPLGGRKRLLEALRSDPLQRLELGEARTRWGETRRQGTVDVDFVAEWPRWRAQGTAHVVFERGAWRHRIRSGFLSGPRDVKAMVGEFLAAHTPAEAMKAIHPNYADGLEGRQELQTRWGQGPHPSGAAWAEVERVELVQGRLDLRPDRSHLDLFLRLPEAGGPRPVTLRLTLAPAAGRWRIVEGFGRPGGRP